MARRLNAKPAAPTPVEATRHTGETRVNIPTAELESLAAADVRAPRVMRYPRDPSLDPQLVWKGKDEQDGEDLAVPVVPVYIQEQISPKALIEDLRAVSAGRREAQLDLFADFDGMPLEERVEFYQHAMHWTNRMILGDSLYVMTSLAQKEGLKGQVQMIYVDPPYGIKFGSNWQARVDRRDVKDGRLEDATRQPEQIRAFRDTWELGIHSYLSYLRDRLVLARELLTDSGSIFIQIGDENKHLVRSVLDEVLGSDNFIAEIAYATTTGRGAEFLDRVTDSVQWYARNRERVKYRQLYGAEPPPTEDFPYDDDPRGPYGLRDSSSQGATETGGFVYTFNGKHFRPPTGRHWSTNRLGLDRLAAARRLYDYGRQLRIKRFRHEALPAPLGNLWLDTQMAGFVRDKIYVVQTHTRVPARCLLMTTDPGDLVLDPTCGSGTTAYVAEQWGRRWITIDTSRVALAIARTRLMAARYPYYLLADSPEGQRREAELSGQAPGGATEGDIRKGFVYERVPHVTLKVDRPEPRHPRGDEPRGDRRGHRPARGDRDPLRPPLRGPPGRPGERSFHRRESVAPSRGGRRAIGPRGPAGTGRGVRPLRGGDHRQPAPGRRPGA
jgi:adenine-specific DNA-methyltransferase